jgi:uncharacterized protein YjiS (DUF1127 family)
MAASYRAFLDMPGRRSLLVRLQTTVFSCWQGYVRWRDRRAALHHLAELDDHMLKDIGISRSEIEWALYHGRSLKRR